MSKQHNHVREPRVWCESCNHIHIESIPLVTFRCRSCGWGQWSSEDATLHWAEFDHDTYTVLHDTRPLTPSEALLVESADRIGEALSQFIRAAGEIRTLGERLFDDSCSCDFGHSSANPACPRNSAITIAGAQILGVLEAMDV